MHALDISPRYWLFMILLGVLVGMSLGVMVWQLGIMDWRSDLVFGIVGGFTVTLLAAIFVTLANRLLRFVTHPVIAYTAGFFATFMAGFLGFWLIYQSTFIFEFKIIPLKNPLLFSMAVGMVSYLIGLMLFWIVRQQIRHDRLQKELLAAQIGMYETQLNPHFLFNALGAVTETMHNDLELADDAMLRLSTLLRRAIRAQSRIPLSEELKNIEDFVWLQNLQAPGEIALELDVPKQFTLCLVPKFSLELLVENAIKHGKYSGRTLHVRVEARLDETGRLEIKVGDDGRGFEVLQYGMGLENLKKRLWLLSQARLEASSGNGKTRFIMKGLTCTH